MWKIVKFAAIPYPVDPVFNDGEPLMVLKANGFIGQ